MSVWNLTSDSERRAVAHVEGNVLAMGLHASFLDAMLCTTDGRLGHPRATQRLGRPQRMSRNRWQQVIVWDPHDATDDRTAHLVDVARRAGHTFGRRLLPHIAWLARRGRALLFESEPRLFDYTNDTWCRDHDRCELRIRVRLGIGPL